MGYGIIGINTNKPNSVKWPVQQKPHSPYMRSKGEIKLVFNLRTGKFLLKGEFLSGLKMLWSDSPQTSNQAFIGVFTVVLQLENTPSWPVRLTGNAYLVS